VIASPEYVDEDPRFRKYLWEVASFRDRVTRIIFDEAHCVLEWADFRPAYRRLHFLCHLLQGATFLALSATLSPDMVQELQRALNLYNLEVIRRSNDRANVSLIARPMKYSFASLHDLAGLVPLDRALDAPPVPKFMVFMRTKKHCERAAKFLRDRLPSKERDRIVWVHAEMTRGFNEDAMAKLRNGELYGVVCTDVAGMVSLNHIYT
jgi:superfamily II DNA helicase RecQ